LYEQALAIDRRIGYRYSEAMDLANLGNVHGDLGSWDRGAGYAWQAIEIADAIGSVQAQSHCRRILAQIQLLAADLTAARQAITAARDHDYPTARAGLSLLSGIIWLRQNQPAAAAREFQKAITQASQQLEHFSRDYDTLDTKALALCGLALTTDPGNAAKAATVFLSARAITNADGITNRTLALFGALAAADTGDILAPIRPAAKGQSTK
jgi:tetratricopeptide (TPR) repeat protein